jgi:GNAT superfamily N-acetyltransferase
MVRQVPGTGKLRERMVRIGPDERVRMERAHVAAWPALETAGVQGWLWRCSGGGSQRANSVSTVDFVGNDIADAVAEVERRYHRHGAAARFQTFDESRPAGLADALRQRGYREGEPTVTMFRRSGPVEPAAAVEVREAAWAGWLEAYLSVITESRRAVNRRILELVPAPRAFFGLQRDGRIIATALCAVSHGCAVVECVATVPQARRTGAAGAVMRTLSAWAARQADLVGLQVVAGNEAAERLYEGLGFVAGARNSFWVESRGS